MVQQEMPSSLQTKTKFLFSDGRIATINIVERPPDNVQPDLLPTFHLPEPLNNYKINRRRTW